MTDLNSDILEELKQITFLLGDLNAIRHGEFDPPTGSGNAAGSQATPNDLASYLARIADAAEELVKETRLVRLAAYGQTGEESGEHYEDPKHGDFGAVAQSSAQVEVYLSEIVTYLFEDRMSK